MYAKHQAFLLSRSFNGAEVSKTIFVSSSSDAHDEVAELKRPRDLGEDPKKMQLFKYKACPMREVTSIFDSSATYETSGSRAGPGQMDY